MNTHLFKLAREAMLKSDYNGSGSSPKIGAVAVYKGSIIAEAWNTDKTSTLQHRYNIYRYNDPSFLSKAHCETQLIQRIRWKCGDSLKWSKVDIYLYRELKDGSLAISRPCKSCLHLLIDCGITHIYYTTDNGFAEEKLTQK